MVSIDFSGKNVLITGGTKGIGLSAALEFAKAGAQTYLTYKWGSADEGELKSQFVSVGGPEPILLQADVSVDEDTEALMKAVAEHAEKLDVFVSNVGFAATAKGLESYKKRSLFKTLEYSTWPLVEYTRKIHAQFGSYPRHIVGISSNGPDHFYPGYDYVAASKALLEFFARYLSIHLFEEGSRVNVLRFGTVQTESFDAIFGEEFFEFIRKEGASENMILQPEPCGKAVFALCSGYLDALNGQIVNVDYGLPYQDNTMVRYLSQKKGASQ
jgi:NAD(P)-dependent dehydrogenase (short-subunit alcohol dehydrogenase family)